ncbi:glutaredoxin domain-containing protein [Clostridium sp. B9]|uniref:glutaredoxin domain-containing protein n=1 Tax=Clostridium sp. B9 TaxID=3423224 RepID=UPI003D2ECAAE
MVKVYSVAWCGPCNKLKKYLEKIGVEYETITVADGKEDRNEVLEVSGQRSVPVAVIGDEVIVGFDKQKIDDAVAKLK